MGIDEIYSNLCKPDGKICQKCGSAAGTKIIDRHWLKLTIAAGFKNR
jgi:hypothetical protein